MSDQHRGEETERTEQDKALTIPEVVWAAARWLAKRELLIRIGVVVLLIGVGVASAAYASNELEKHDAKIVVSLEKFDASIDVRVTKLEQAAAAQLEREAARDRMVLETNLNVRLFLESQKIKPIDVPRSAVDGGSDAGR